MSCACSTVICEHTPRVGKSPDRPQEHAKIYIDEILKHHDYQLRRAADHLKSAQEDRKRWEDALHLVQESVNACNDRIRAAEEALRAAVEAR